MSRPKYNARGRDRGACGHEHASIALAFECCRRDWLAAEAEGDRSDRQVQRCDRRELTQREFEAVTKLEEADQAIADACEGKRNSRGALLRKKAARAFAAHERLGEKLSSRFSKPEEGK
jgi:hypothetical protein